MREPSAATVVRYHPPIRWEELLRFLSARAIPGVEVVAGQGYARTAIVNGCIGWLRVEPVRGLPQLQVEVSSGLVPVLAAALDRIHNLFDLAAQPNLIDDQLIKDARIGPLVQACPGLRVPGAFDGFELALRAVLGQQISVRAASTLAGRLAAAFGTAVETSEPSLVRFSPAAETLADLDLRALTSCGLTSARAECVRELARASASGFVNLGPAADPQPIIQQLLTLRGIGPWTAQYIAMRALRWPDAFPSGDLGLRKALGFDSEREVREASMPWQPWRAYAAMHLWNSLTTPPKEPKTGRNAMNNE